MIFVPDELKELSPASLAICKRVLNGESEKAIAKSLDRSVHTVHSHIKQIYKKAGVTSQRELAAIVIERLMRRVIQLERAEASPSSDGPGDTRRLVCEIPQQAVIGIDAEGSLTTLSSWQK